MKSLVKIIVGASLSIAFGAQLSSSFAQGTAFTYQGRLNVGGGPANGLYDFRFRLASDPLANNYVGSPYLTNAIAVTNGLFTTTVNFGTIFNGNNYWLEVDVRTNGSGSYTMLNPLQLVTPAPSAIYAATAGGVTGGLTIQQNTNGAPNVIGGASINYVGASVIGATISGGGATNSYGTAYSNSVTASYSTIGGGVQNLITNIVGTISGGFENIAGGYAATVGGGDINTATGQEATISGGANNSASDTWATIGGGSYNGIIQGAYATVAGGYHNIITNGFASTIGGGYSNATSVNYSSYATVSGGGFNIASSNSATVSGGYQNTASGQFAIVGGGYTNIAGGQYSIIGGGDQNAASGYAAIVGGGGFNTAITNFTTVSGGYFNTASGLYSIVGGGFTNIASGSYSTITGGSQNVVSGTYSTVDGGLNNLVSGAYSFAAGSNARATNNGAFVWGDPIGQLFYSTADNQFSVRATGGVRFVSASSGNNPTAGVSLAPGGGSWSSLSDRNAKENFRSVDAEAVLSAVSAMPLSIWNYKTQAKSIRHIGPMAQDFYAAFSVGEDDKHITEIDESGVALAAIQALAQKLEAKDTQIETLQKHNQLLADRLAKLEFLVKKLDAEK